jgi:hypothetical protein
MSLPPIPDVPEYIRQQFKERGGVDIFDVTVRPYPDETNYIVLVDEADLPVAAGIGNDLDAEISTPGSRAFVIVRKAPPELVEARSTPLSSGIQDSRVTDLTHLISARSRVSEAQPSLSYVHDVTFNLSAIEAPRHHLIFGRRGAGKTALLVEARRKLSASNSISVWINMQTLRHEPVDRVFLHTMEELLSVVAAHQQRLRTQSAVSIMTVELFDEVRSLLTQQTLSADAVIRLVPRVHRTIKRFIEGSGLRLFFFIDDFYFLPRASQPQLLDVLHSCLRDCDAWLKIASIRHLTRWFQSSPPLGLQTMHDADLLDLDVTLQTPSRAKSFLESILKQYARHVGVPSLAGIFHPEALDRLVLASGAVPRDYLILAGSAISKAQRRANAKQVGVQDVNQAAGDAAQVKLQELEEDMAFNVADATRTLEALKRIRAFCLEETSFTYFLVRYRDKENVPKQYNVLTDLLDQRLIHLLDAGVSDAHSAGERSEAFMLDLSQFSGLRLKQGIQVLDFSSGRLVARKTRTKAQQRIGNTSRQVIAILRAAPTFELSRLEDLVEPSTPG